jgi:DNA-binding response OmpR family regulator
MSARMQGIQKRATGFTYLLAGRWPSSRGRYLRKPSPDLWHRRNRLARILVIEDNDLEREMFQEVLVRAGYEVDVAANGEEGLSAFRDVQADIMMPEKDGVELIRDLRQEFPETRIIAITGVRGRYNRLPAASNLGANHTLMKPFQMQDLLDKIGELLED